MRNIKGIKVKRVRKIEDVLKGDVSYFMQQIQSMGGDGVVQVDRQDEEKNIENEEVEMEFG